MTRLTLSLSSDEDRTEMQRAARLFRKAVAAGWRGMSAETGFQGGMPGGRFVIRRGHELESVPFRLGPTARAGFEDLVRSLAAEEEKAPGRALLDVRLEDSGTRLVLVTGPESKRRSRAASPDADTNADAVVVRRFRNEMKSAMERHPTIYDLKEEAALRGLREGTGSEADQMRALVGEEYFRLLSDLARQTRSRTGGMRSSLGKVLVLPGIMGSKLGREKSLLGWVDYSDVIWLDPVDMRLGRLADLALGPGGKPRKGTQSVGVLYSFYLRLKLTLDRAGFDADFHHYDWRRPVRDLGKEFAAFLNRQKEPVTVVAHSMGGIVTRAAIQAGARADKLKRVIMIGTPNHGSFVPAQALRAAYPFLKTLARTFDRDLATVTEEVFSTFAGLYDLLPAPETFPDYPIFDSEHWPQSKPRPNSEYLESARSAQSLLAPADERFHLICGVNQDTVVGIRKVDDEFVFLQNKDGDGTVPRISAELPGCPTLYVEGSHGMLPNYGSVCDLAVDLATQGRTGRATLVWTPPPSGVVEEVRESVLRSAVEVRGMVVGAEPSPEAMRGSLIPLMGLPPLEGVGGGSDAASSGLDAGPLAVGGRPGMPASDPGSTEAVRKPAAALFREHLKGVVLGRRRQRQLEVALSPGSLTDVPSRAYVLGLFQGVAPAGAAQAIDERMDLAVGDFVRRRMLSGRLGEVFIMPKGRSYILADHVIFVGLGPFDHFRVTSENGDSSVMRLVCESVVRTCLRANVEEFATILLGGSAAGTTGDAVRVFTHSFLDAMKVADPERRLRKVTLCETDPQRVAEIRTELLRLATTDLFEDVELELRDLEAPKVQAAPVARQAALPSRPTPVYLLTRMFDPSQETGSGTSPGRPLGAVKGVLRLETSLLLPRSKGAILTVRSEVEKADWEALKSKIGNGGFSEAVLDEIGRDLAAFAFRDDSKETKGEDFRAALRELARNHRHRPLVVVHDPVASQLPWEAFRFEDWRPSIEGGVSRQHLDANLSVAKWLEERRVRPTLEVLLVTNPTEDLDGAEREGKRLRDLLSQVPNTSLTERRGRQATRRQLLEDFQSGRFDVIHYAGHAFFSVQHPGRSGLLCSGKEVLSGIDLAGLSQLPSLIFFNACEAARIRGAGPVRGRKQKKTPVPGTTTEGNLSVAAALIRGGVANFLGTYWPVGDAPAEVFSRVFYEQLVRGRAIGDAVLEGRKAVAKLGSADWADYVFYGNPDFALKPGTES